MPQFEYVCWEWVMLLCYLDKKMHFEKVYLCLKSFMY